MPYALEVDKQARSARHYADNREYFSKKHQRWKDENPKKYAFLGQRHTSKQRGVEFNLTFAEWVAFWGDDFHLRGIRNENLQMCRYGDVGAYEVGNIYKDTKLINRIGPRAKADKEKES